MENKVKNNLVSLALIFIMLTGVYAPFVNAADAFGGGEQGFFNNPQGYGSTTNNYQTSSPNFGSFYGGLESSYWPILTQLEKDQCDAVSSDFIIGIPLGGCQPMVVRSDLLAEQNVPVFCQLSAVRVNPLIKVSSIKSISFKGDYPEDVAGISFHPARAAVNSYNTLLGDPVSENIGYVVIVLKRQVDEDKIPEYVFGNLTATIRYDMEKAYGAGLSEYYLEPKTDDEWSRTFNQNSFWGGKGYVRAVDVTRDGAVLEVLTNEDEVYRSFTLKSGETSPLIYFPNSYCTVGVNVKLNSIENSEPAAFLSIDNEDQLWVRAGTKILDGKCTVRSVDVFGGGSGKIEIGCPGDNFQLYIKDSGAIFDVNGTNKTINFGGEINKKVVGYYDENIAVLFDNKLTSQRATDIASVFENVNTSTDEGIKSAGLKLNDSKLGYKGKYKIVTREENYAGIVYHGTYSSIAENSGDEKPYLDKGSSVVKQLIEEFPSEKKGTGAYWGEEALFEQILLTKDARDESSLVDLIDLFVRNYPESDYLAKVREIGRLFGDYDYSNAYYSIRINNEYHDIGVVYFEPKNNFEEKATLSVNGRRNTFEVGKVYDISGNVLSVDNITAKAVEQQERFELTKISTNGVTLRIFYKGDKDKITPNNNLPIGLEKSAKAGSNTFTLEDTEIYEVAHVSVIPEVRDTKTEANFTFRIGVEKRALEITPEKALQKIDELNKTIADWNERLDQLGDLITGLKGACFALSSVLMIKSMVSGVSGEALARRQVMDRYKVQCSIETSQGKHDGDMSKCYSAYSSGIDSEVKQYENGINNVNGKIENINAGVEKTGLLGTTETVTDEAKYVAEAKNRLGINGNSFSYTVDGFDDAPITGDDLTTSSQVKAAGLWNELDCANIKLDCNSGVGNAACCSVKKDLDGVLYNTALMKKDNKGVNLFNAANGVSVRLPSTADAYSSTRRTVQTENLGQAIGDKISATDNVASVLDQNGTQYLVVVSGGQASAYKATKAYKLNTDGSLGNENSVALGEINTKYTFSQPDPNSCTNVYKNPSVRYYESGDNKNFPSVVPISIKQGWYAYIPSTEDGLMGSKGAYEASGAVNYFYVCNVGKDGIASNGPAGGDSCHQFNINNPVFDFFGPCSKMSTAEVRALYNKALNLIREAAKSKGSISVDGELVTRGNPVAATSGLDCEQFMSPSECSALFNVCDPVICPTSRCDLGGKFPVSDVIQSGIIGSLTLCLPNFGTPAEGGVMIPICLSGVHAGIDSYVSILESYQSCLQERVDSGSYVGICDEITSIYMCEFFWRQAAPFLDNLIYALLDFGSSKTKGGAEYLTAQAAYDNAKDSATYFTQEYAAGAFRAFQVKNTEELGSTVCNGFIGTSLPTSADAIDSLLEPESPVQFSAYFSETPFTDATVPSTSQYNLFYHIYAGNDQGTQYRIYMKNPPESGYYATRQIVSLKTGYVQKGSQATESLDFTAPAGYKELCVEINSKEECGFGKVSSSFAVDYASSKYTEDQAAQTGITTEEDCRSGTYSEWGLLNLNAQQGIENALSSNDVSSAGVTRVCSSASPGIGQPAANNVVTCDGNEDCEIGYTCKADSSESDANQIKSCQNSEGAKQISTSRWIDVGYCGTPSLRCWLDQSSVKQTLKIVQAVEGSTALETVRYGEQLGSIESSYKQVAEKLAAQYSSMLKLTPAQLVLGDSDDSIKDIISKLDEVAGVEADNNGEGTNANKAEALALKATLYRLIAKELMERKVNAEVQGTQAAEDSNADTTPTTDVVVSEPVIIIDTNSDQLWIVYNNVKTSYYLQQKADDGYIIWRAVSGAANNNVGSINATGFIEIRSSEAEKVFVSGTTLKQLSDYEFVSGSNSFEKRVVVSPSTPIKEEEVKVDAVNNEKISQENVISLEISQKVGDKSYITNNKENTKYYLKTNGAGYEIFRGMPWWKTDYSVGSIRTTGTININSADEENVDFIEGMKLGDLEKYRFLDNKFVE